MNSNGIQFHSEQSPFGLCYPALMSLLFKCVWRDSSTVQPADCPLGFLTGSRALLRGERAIHSHQEMAGRRYIFKATQKAGEMGQLVMCFPFKHENLNSTARTYLHMSGISEHTCHCSVGEVVTRKPRLGGGGCHRLASLLELDSCNSVEGPCF